MAVTPNKCGGLNPADRLGRLLLREPFILAGSDLREFANWVEAQPGIHISEADADSLIAAAQAILAQLTGS